MMQISHRRAAAAGSPRTPRRTVITALLGVGVMLGAVPGGVYAQAGGGPAAGTSGNAARTDGNDWPMLRGNPQRSGVAPAEDRVAPPLSLLWRFTATYQRENPCAPAIVGNTAYFAAGSTAAGGGVVYAVDTATGALRWRYPSEGGLPGHVFQTAPLVDGGLVYIGASDGQLYVLRANNGDFVKTFRTRGPILSAPTIQNGTLFFGSNDDTLYALDPATGAQRWRQNYAAGDNINSAPVFADGRVFFTTTDQFLHSVEEATGIPKWKFRLPSRFMDNAPVFADNTLYIPSGQRLFAFVPRSGSQRWVQTLPNDILTPPVGEGGIVYVIDRDRKMYALRSRDGREAWPQPAQLPYAAAAAPTISGDVLYVPTSRNVVMAVSRENGKLLWEYAIEPSSGRANVAPPTYTSIAAPMAISNGTLYVLSDDGSLSTFRPDAPDTTGPLASQFFPKPGSVVNGQPPLPFAATVTDPGSGLNQESIELSLDGQKLDATFDTTRNLVYYSTAPAAGVVNPPLPNGRHTVTLTARDWRGNERQETWSFVVDNSLPVSVNREQQAPAAPRATRSGTTARARTNTNRQQPAGVGQRPGRAGTTGPRRGTGPARGTGPGGVTPNPPATPAAPPPPPPPGLE